MMRSLYNGVSGLTNHQLRMDVISNNLANVNTIGFKKNVCNFRSIWYDTLSGAPPMRDGMAGINPKQVGLGSAIASTTTIFNQGNTERTNRTLDMSISGNGFYIMRKGNVYQYTRAGAFILDANGVLSDPATGFKVQGWMGENGRVEAMGRTEDIVIPLNLKKDARATSVVEHLCNLQENHGPNWGEDPAVESTWRVTDNAGNVGDLVMQYVKTGLDTWQWTVYDNRGGTFSETTGVIEIDNDGNIVTSETAGGATSIAFTPVGGTAVTVELPPVGTNIFDTPENFAYAVSAGGQADVFRASYTRDFHDVAGVVYDSLGTEHTMTVRYERIAPVGGLDTWQWTVINVTDIDPASALVSSNGINGFSGTGQIQFGPNGRFANQIGGPNQILIDSSNLANRITIDPDFTMVTQYDSAYTTQQVDQNGYPMGIMTNINIDDYGYVKVIYSNGITDAHARIALKLFANPSGLTKVGDTSWTESFNSGEGMVGAPGDGSAGKIYAGTLEMSNVNLAEEFTNMIVTQRGFQANTRVITTSDEMLTDLIGLKR